MHCGIILSIVRDFYLTIPVISGVNVIEQKDMTESTLILLLKKFDKQQLKEFNNFVKSPFFNSNKALIKLYEYIRKQYPDYEAAKLRKEFVFSKVFGKTAYNDGFLRVLMSNLQSLVEEYLTFTGMAGHPLLKKKFLLDQLVSLGESKLAERVLKSGLKSIKDHVPNNPDDYLGMYYLAFYKKYFYSTKFFVSKGNLPEEDLYEEQKYLNYHFLLVTLANHFYQLNQKQVINYEPKLIFLNEITAFLNNNPEYLESPLLNITYLRVMLLKNNDTGDFYKLKNAFYSSFDKLDNKDCFNTISIVINYCQRNYYETDDELFIKEKFEILKFAVENDLNSFEKTDGFDEGRFSGIVSTALDLGETDWTEKFISEYGEEIESEYKEYHKGFAIAALELAKGNLDESLSHLSRLKNPTATTHKFNLKVLQLKLYYEKGFYDQAEAAADSFRHLIQSDTLLPESVKESNKNFQYYFTKLINAAAKENIDSVRGLTDKLRSLKPVNQKKWLIDKTYDLLEEKKRN